MYSLLVSWDVYQERLDAHLTLQTDIKFIRFLKIPLGRMSTGCRSSSSRWSVADDIAPYSARMSHLSFGDWGEILRSRKMCQWHFFGGVSFACQYHIGLPGRPRFWSSNCKKGRKTPSGIIREYHAQSKVQIRFFRIAKYMYMLYMFSTSRFSTYMCV